MKVCTDSCLFGAWVAAKLEQQAISPKNIIDAGTGTGLLSLMLAQKSEAQIHAVDIDKNAFEEASVNFNAAPWNKRMQAFHADIKDWNGSGKYDLIIANPPFYESDLVPEDKAKARSKHSTTLRLEDLLFTAKNLLTEGGNLAVLLPWTRGKWFESAASAYSLFTKEKTEVKQTAKHNFFRTMLLLQNQERCIAKSEHNYKKQ